MKGCFRFSMFMMAAPLLCGAALVIGYVMLVALAIPQLPEWSQPSVEQWLFDVPQHAETSDNGSPGGYDHNYVLAAPAKTATPFARVLEPQSGRTMEVSTTEPGVQLYTGNHLRNVIGAGGARFGSHGGFCLETQHYPDSPNKPQFPSCIVRPGQAFKSTTIFKFGAK